MKINRKDITMAQYMHLDIYKKAYEFLVYYSCLLVHMQREYRYTIGEKLLNLIIEFIVSIYKANDAKTNTERAKAIRVMIEKIKQISVTLRLVNSLKNISNEKYLNCCLYVEDIEKQLSGWLNYTSKNAQSEKINQYKTVVLK